MTRSYQLSIPGRPGKHQRPRALGEVGVEHEIRNAAEMIAMEMGDQDGVDRVARDAEALEPNERGRAAIDQEIRALADHMEAGVELPARAERVAAADELQMHRGAPAPFSLGA